MASSMEVSMMHCDTKNSFLLTVKQMGVSWSSQVPNFEHSIKRFLNYVHKGGQGVY